MHHQCQYITNQPNPLRLPVLFSSFSSISTYLHSLPRRRRRKMKRPNPDIRTQIHKPIIIALHRPHRQILHQKNSLLTPIPPMSLESAPNSYQRGRSEASSNTSAARATLQISRVSRHCLAAYAHWYRFEGFWTIQPAGRHRYFLITRLVMKNVDRR